MKTKTPSDWWFYGPILIWVTVTCALAFWLCISMLNSRDLEKENYKLVSQVEILQSAIGNRLDRVGYSCLELTDPGLERQVKIMEKMLDKGYELDRFELYMKPTK